MIMKIAVRPYPYGIIDLKKIQLYEEVISKLQY